MLRRAAWTCKRTPAGWGMHSCNKVPAKHNHARSWCCCSLELTCRLLWASFQFTPRSWKSSVLLRNCSARTWTHAPFESWIGENWAEPLPFDRAIRPEVWNHFRYGTKQNARVQRWHDFQPDVPTFNGSTPQRLLAQRLWRAWASVATRHSCSCACLSISPSLCVLLSECCLPTTSTIYYA